METLLTAVSPSGKILNGDFSAIIVMMMAMMMIMVLMITMTMADPFCLQYIENLDKLRKLHVLNLSHNMIERMEKLDKLLRLRELNLSHNCLIRIEGIENLTGLQVLNVSGNNIEHVPVWLPKKLQALRTFRIADNRLASVSVYLIGGGGGGGGWGGFFEPLSDWRVSTSLCPTG